jgi:hypothetical protein
MQFGTASWRNLDFKRSAILMDSLPGYGMAVMRVNCPFGVPSPIYLERANH